MKYFYIILISAFLFSGCLTVERTYTDFKTVINPEDGSKEQLVSFNDGILLRRDIKTETLMNIPTSKKNVSNEELKRLRNEKSVVGLVVSVISQSLFLVGKEDDIIKFRYEAVTHGSSQEMKTIISKDFDFDSSKSNIFECESAKIQILYGTKNSICCKILKEFDAIPY